jgi:prepilin-type N-terminal cleavage/methylation domain-containing protein
MIEMKLKIPIGQRGFTLLEVLTVIGIIGILTVLAIPAARKVEKVVLETGAVKGMKVIQEAFELYYREMGFYPVHTEEPSRLFFREIDRFLPDTYYIRHSENQFIRGYRLFAHGIPPPGAGGESPGGGFGGFGGSGNEPERWGSHNFVLMAVPIESHLGLSTFYIDPGGVVTRDSLLTPY